MEIVVKQEQGHMPVTVFHIIGDLTTDETLRVSAEQAHREGMRNLLIDLSEVPLVNSTGLRALHDIYILLRGDTPGESDQAVKEGINAGTFTSPHLKLCNPSKHVLDVLKVTGYDMFLEIYQDYHKAVASF
jgi:STAS domain